MPALERETYHGEEVTRLFLDPRSRLVMVHTAMRKQSVDRPGVRKANALWEGVLRALGEVRASSARCRGV